MSEMKSNDSKDNLRRHFKEIKSKKIIELTKRYEQNIKSTLNSTCKKTLTYRDIKRFLLKTCLNLYKNQVSDIVKNLNFRTLTI